jgi:hypothetical protein
MPQRHASIIVHLRGEQSGGQLALSPAATTAAAINRFTFRIADLQ